MPEMTAMPSLTSALMPASAPALRPATVADSNAGNAPNPAGPAAENPQGAVTDNKDPGPDAVVAQGANVSPFAAIMQRHLAQAAARTDAVAVADLAAAPVKKAAVAEESAPDPAADNLAALLPLIQSLAANMVQPGTASEKIATRTKQDAAPADLAAAPVNKAAEPVADLTAVKVGDLTSTPVADPAPVKKAATPVTNLAAAPVNKAAEDIAPGPADCGLAAVLPMIQSLVPNKARQPELDAVSEKRQGAAPSAPQLFAGATAVQANMASGAAETLVAAASDKAAITAALSAPTGDVMAAHARQVEAAAPDGTFENLLAAAQIPTQTHPSDARSSLPLHVETPVGASGWNDNVGEKLVWMVGRQEQRAELVLNPPQLGRVEVSLSMNGDQVNAQFVSANPAVRDALEAALPRLREMLADSGVSLGQTQVGSESANNAANQSANRQENRDNASRGSAGLGALRQMNASAPWLRQGNGMVDVFA